MFAGFCGVLFFWGACLSLSTQRAKGAKVFWMMYFLADVFFGVQEPNAEIERQRNTITGISSAKFKK